MALYEWVRLNVMKIAAALSVVFFVILVAIKVFFSLSYLPDLSGSETSTIFPIQFLADGRSIYSDPEEPPFRFTQYTPLYLVIASSFFKLTGWLPEEVHKVFVASRFLSLGFTLVAACTVAWILTLFGKRKKIVGILAGCLIFQILGLWILTSSRPDSLMVFLTSLYVFAVFKALDSPTKSHLWYILAIFISVSAFYVKQSGAIHSIALAVFCVYQGQWKLLAKLIVSGLVFFLLYYLILPTDSVRIFSFNIIGGVANSISWNWFYTWTLESLLLQFAPLIICNFLISIYSIARPSSDLYKFLSISSLVFFASATATAFKVGAGVGYYQDYLILAVIQITLFFTEPVRKSWFEPKIIKAILACYFVLVSIHCTLFVYMAYSKQPGDLYLHHYIKERDVADYLVKEKGLKETDWVYVCDADRFQNVYLRHFLFRNILVPFPDVVYLADKNQTFDFEKFKMMTADQEIRFVVAGKGEKPKNILGYDFGNLKKIKSIDNYDIYEY
jgi:hypothetical protein